MPPKKLKLDDTPKQKTLIDMFARQSQRTSNSTPPCTDEAQESKNRFLIDFEIVIDENECGINWTLLFNSDSRIIFSGTSSDRIQSESDIEIDRAEADASTSLQLSDSVQFDEIPESGTGQDEMDSGDENVASMH